MRVLLACAVVIPALAISRPAGADGAGVIAVSKSDRGAVAAAMGQAMAGRAGRISLDAVTEARGAIAAGAVPTEALQAFRKVREQIDLGWRDYLRVAVESAASRLVAARTAAKPLVGLPGGPELYADAALRLGVVLGHLGRTTESQAVFSLAVALDPDRPITKAEFAPDVVTAIEAARAAPVALQRVHVTSVPAGAAIQIDGKAVGRAPIDVQVTRGQHLVVAHAPLYAPAVQAVPIDASAVEVVLERDDAAIRLTGGAELGLAEREAQQLVDATLRFADLDEVVLVAETTRRGGPTLLVQRCAGIPARAKSFRDGVLRRVQQPTISVGKQGREEADVRLQGVQVQVRRRRRRRDARCSASAAIQRSRRRRRATSAASTRASVCAARRRPSRRRAGESARVARSRAVGD